MNANDGGSLATIAVSGTTLHYEESGTGDAVVLVHGSASDHRTWTHQQADLADGFRILAYSRRYHFPNAEIRPDQEYDMLTHVSDLAEFIRARELDPCHLIGHSYGAFLGLLLAARHPQLFRRLILLEPPAMTLFVSSTPKPTEIVRLLATRPGTAVEIIRFGANGVVPATRAFRNGDTGRGIQLFGDAVFGRGGFERLSAEQKARVADNAANIRAEILGPGFAELSVADVARVERPVLLVDGSDSIGLFRRINDRLEELLPNVERVRIPGAGHLIHEDQPTAFNAVALAFLNQHGSAA